MHLNYKKYSFLLPFYIVEMVNLLANWEDKSWP